MSLLTPFRKAFSMLWSGAQTTSWLLLPRTRFDYAKEVGNGSGSSIVVAVVGWISRNFPEAPVVVMDERADGQRLPVKPHPMAKLIEQPNPFYSGPLLWVATIVDRATSGNAYWLKIRNAQDKPVQLWWAPSSTMTPKWPEDGKTFISHYEYKPDPSKSARRVEVRDVVHFRYGLDPKNPRKGASPLYSVLREIFTDDEAANFTASLMRNLGVPGVIISPDGMPAGAKINPDDAEKTKQDFKRNFGGDNRGEPMVMTAPTKVQVLSFSPEQMLLRDLRRIPEERVSGIFGVAAVVAGLGAGLDRSTFTNFGEAREAAYEENIVPTQRLIASELRTQLLPDFGMKETHMVEFDISRVRVLQPDMDKLYERMDRGIRGGWVMVSEAKRAVGLPTDDSEDYYLRQFTAVPIPQAQGAGVPPSVLATGGGKGQKAAGTAFAGRLALVRARIAERYEGEVERFFVGQAKRVKSRIANVVNLRGANGHRKDQLFTSAYLLPDEEDALLVAALTPLWLTGMESGWGMAVDSYRLDAAWDAESVIVASILAEAAYRAKRINGGTRAAIDTALQVAAASNYNLQQIINGVEEDGFAGLTSSVESYYQGRPFTIAQTESMWATGQGTAGAYQAAGHNRVMLWDMGDDPECVARNGRVVSVAEGQSELGREHPNGTLTLIPV